MNGIGVLIGLVSGTVVGASAIGSGSLVIPLLLLLTPVSAGTAVGTSVALATVTKFAGYLSHRQLGHVHPGLGRWLILGAVPGTVVAVVVLSSLQHVALPGGHARQLFGVLLVVLAIVLLAATTRPASLATPSPPTDEPQGANGTNGDMRAWALLVGTAVSFVVTLTSIGSGGLSMLALLLWRPAWVGQLVGTATFYGLVAALFGTVAHLALHTIDPYLLAQLAAGSIPGVLFGSRLTRRIPEAYYQAGIGALTLALGLRLAWAG